MALLFDLDGTLLDTAPDFALSLNLLKSQIINKNEYQDNLDKPKLFKYEIDKEITVENLMPHISGGATAMTKFAFGINDNHPLLIKLKERFIDIYSNNLLNKTTPFKGIEQLLAKLENKKIPWGVVTNKPKSLTIPLMEKIGYINRASCIISGDSAKRAKPYPDSLFLAANELSIDPKKCIYIGDHKRDIDAGKSAGMKTIGALFGYIENKDEALKWDANYYVNSPDEIWPLFEQIY